MNLAFDLPINALSFGQVSVNILKEIHRRGYSPCVFPFGGKTDLTVFGKTVSDDFKKWLNSCISVTLLKHKRSVPVFKLWHIRHESLQSCSEKQILYTFHELDGFTDIERNIVENQATTIFSSTYSRNVFGDAKSRVISIPLGFDKDSFKVIPKKKPVIVFTLTGKLEKRKHHLKILKLWAKRFGNDKRFLLNCALTNNFMKPEEQQAIIFSALEGKKYFNINTIGFMQLNEAFNDFLNYGDIALALSGGEGFGLPEFQSVALGKHCVGLNAHGYKDWMTAENTVLVNPNGKEPCYDGKFFAQGLPYNQGNIFTFDENEVITAMETAIKRFESSPVNTEGLKLQTQFTYEKMVDEIIKVSDEL